MARAKGKSLSPEQNGRVRAAVRDQLLPRFKGIITPLAKELGISQAGLSSFLSERTGAGPQFAMRVAEKVGMSFMRLVNGAEDRIVYAGPDETTRPVWRNLPEWREVAAAAVRRNAVLREHPQAVTASGETASLFISGPLTPEMVVSQALLWLQIGDPKKLEAIEAEDYARADLEAAAARARADRADEIHHERTARGEPTAPAHQIAATLERKEKALGRKASAANDAPARPANQTAAKRSSGEKPPQEPPPNKRPAKK